MDELTGRRAAADLDTRPGGLGVFFDVDGWNAKGRDRLRFEVIADATS